MLLDSSYYLTSAMKPLIRKLTSSLLVGSGAVLVSGCETTQVALQWSDPQFAGRSLRGEKVLVVCEAPDVAIRNTCQEDVARNVRETGATPVISSAPELTIAPTSANDATISAARAAGAKAVLGSKIDRDVTVVGTGSSFGFGVGGLGGGGGSGRGVGIGYSFPTGGGQQSGSYKSSMVLTDVASARVMWSGTITTQASDDIRFQVYELSRVGVETAQKAGFF